MQKTEYYSISGLENFYLEDSWLLGITETPNEISFSLDIVLTEHHPEYSPPSPEFRYCYRRGVLIFRELEEVIWQSKTMKKLYDATGEVDYGNIDFFYYEDGWYYIGGFWGDLKISSINIPVINLTT